MIEMDPGSSQWDSFTLVRVEEEAEKAAVCRRLEEMMAEAIEREVERGYTLRFVTRLPSRMPRCGTGTLWRAMRRAHDLVPAG
jgi:hypothetical protein